MRCAWLGLRVRTQYADHTVEIDETACEVTVAITARNNTTNDYLHVHVIEFASPLAVGS